MAGWETQFSKQAEADMTALTKVVRKRVLAKPEWLELFLCQEI